MKSQFLTLIFLTISIWESSHAISSLYTGQCNSSTPLLIEVSTVISTRLSFYFYPSTLPSLLQKGQMLAISVNESATNSTTWKGIAALGTGRLARWQDAEVGWHNLQCEVHWGDELRSKGKEIELPNSIEIKCQAGGIIAQLTEIQIFDQTFAGYIAIGIFTCCGVISCCMCITHSIFLYKHEDRYFIKLPVASIISTISIDAGVFFLCMIYIQRYFFHSLVLVFLSSMTWIPYMPFLERANNQSRGICRKTMFNFVLLIIVPGIIVWAITHPESLVYVILSHYLITFIERLYWPRSPIPLTYSIFTLFPRPLLLIYIFTPFFHYPTQNHVENTLITFPALLPTALLLCILILLAPLFRLIKCPTSKNSTLSIRLLDETCSICLDDTHEEDEEGKRMKCGHWFHKDCINHWIDVKNNCPVCRQKF